jgi:predicted nuclease with TOPRIM domain
MNDKEEIYNMLLRIESDNADLVDRVARLEAEVSHLTANTRAPEQPARLKRKTDTIWTYGPSVKYNRV